MIAETMDNASRYIEKRWPQLLSSFPDLAHDCIVDAVLKVRQDYDGRGTFGGRVSATAGLQFLDKTRIRLGYRRKHKAPAILPLNKTMKLRDKTVDCRDAVANVKNAAKYCGWKYEIVVERLEIGFTKTEIAQQLRTSLPRVCQMVQRIRTVARMRDGRRYSAIAANRLPYLSVG